MRAQHRYTYGRGSTAELGISKNLGRLADNLGLFLVVPRLGVDLGVMTEEIERIRMRQHLSHTATFEIGAG
jgi:hypothetical protein